MQCWSSWLNRRRERSTWRETTFPLPLPAETRYDISRVTHQNLSQIGGIVMRAMTSHRMQVLAVAGAMLIAGFFLGAAVKKYQVTGNVLEVSDTMIAVDKAGDRWELERNADTKVTGDLKVGAKVTAHYRMVATDVEVK
jgi:hypothetical protein